MKGHKPKPTQLKLVTGNPGKRPLNKSEPIAPGRLLAAPEWMTQSQRDGWDYAIKNAPQGLLRRLDRSILTTFVVAEDFHREAAVNLAKSGPLVKRKKTQTEVQSPYLLVLNRQAQIMLRAAEQLGFSPSSRSRIVFNAAPDQAPSDPAERFFGDAADFGAEPAGGDD
jgi:P27 family predicted phage terminase small subunit